MRTTRPFSIVLQTGYDRATGRDTPVAGRWVRRQPAHTWEHERLVSRSQISAPALPAKPDDADNHEELKKYLRLENARNGLLLSLAAQLKQAQNDAEKRQNSPFSEPLNRGLIKQYLDTVNSLNEMVEQKYQDKTKSFTEQCLFLECAPFWKWSWNYKKTEDSAPFWQFWKWSRKKVDSKVSWDDYECSPCCCVVKTIDYCNDSDRCANCCAGDFLCCCCCTTSCKNSRMRFTRTCVHCCSGFNFLLISILLGILALFVAYRYFVSFSGRDGSYDELVWGGSDGEHGLKVFFGWPDDSGNAHSIQYHPLNGTEFPSHGASMSESLLAWISSDGSNTTERCPINETGPGAQQPFPQDAGDLPGWVRSLYAGLMLGVVFGFLDNWGLFYGMDQLDPVFYVFATTVISALSERRSKWEGDGGERDKWVKAWNKEHGKEYTLTEWKDLRGGNEITDRIRANLEEGSSGEDWNSNRIIESSKAKIKELTPDDASKIMKMIQESKVHWQEEKIMRVHKAASDVMAGLGNTFSDFLGILLGTAALEIAKVGLNTDPSFWGLDLISIVLGCLLGCFLPALQKHALVLADGEPLGRFLEITAAVAQLFVLASVLFAGFPTCHGGPNVHLTFFYLSLIFISIPTGLMVLLLIYSILPQCPGLAKTNICGGCLWIFSNMGGIGKFTNMLEDLQVAQGPIITELERLEWNNVTSLRKVKREEAEKGARSPAGLVKMFLN